MSLSIRFSAPGDPTPMPPGSGAHLQVGQTVSGALVDADTPDRYAVFGASGDLISVGMFAVPDSRVVPTFAIYAPDGSIAASADAAGNSSALVSALRLPSTGAYIIYARPARPDALGGYTLSIGAGWILRDLDGSTLKLGAAYAGALPRLADRQVWRLELRLGALFSVLAQPTASGSAGGSADSALDPVIEVVTPRGDQLAVAHDFSPARSAQTALIRAPMTGTYLIRVSAYANQTTGAYDLIALAPPAAPTPAPNVTAEPLNQRIDGHVAAGSQYSALLHGVPGQLVQIEVHVRSNGFDPVLEVYGPSGRRVAEADDTADSADALLKTTLNDGVGVYTVKISGYALMGGDFTLIMRSP